jgi:hypothetical protein
MAALYGRIKMVLKVLALDISEEAKANGYVFSQATGKVRDKYRQPCVDAVCPTCNNHFWARQRPRKTATKQIFCSRICFFASGEFNPPTGMGEKHSNWKGGISLRNGYKVITHGENSGKIVHRMIAEEVLGRSLKRHEVVHHIDGGKTDNRNENLLVCSSSYHTTLHNKIRWRKQNGSQNFGT